MAALVILALFLAQYRQKEKATAFVEVASRLHRERLKGTVPLSLQSDSPAQISNWVSGRVPFHFRLPSYTTDDKNATTYHLEGCRLVHFQGGQAAHVAYQIGGKPISLLAISAADAKAWGGDTTISHELTFHSLSVGGFRVMTWSVHQVTYSPLGSGFLTGTIKQNELEPDDYRRQHYLRTAGDAFDKNQALVENVRAIAGRCGLRPGY